MTDVGQLVLDGVVAAVSGLGAAGAIILKLSNKITALEKQNESLKEDLKKLEEELEKQNESLKEDLKKLEEEVEEDRKTGAEQWRELSYTLGTIDGMMKGAPPPPRLGGR
jgi:chromosome segregation ATPase